MRRFWVVLVWVATTTLTGFSQSPDELVTGAVLKFEAGELTECLNDLEKALAGSSQLSAKSLAQAHLYRGRLYLRQQKDSVTAGKTEKFGDAQLMALNEYQNALKADDGTVRSVIELQLNQLYPLLFNTGVEAYNNSLDDNVGNQNELLTQAEKYLLAAQQIKPDNYQLSDLIGRVYKGMGRDEEALGHYRNARRQYRPMRSREPDFVGITNIFLSAAMILRDHPERPSYSQGMESVQSGIYLLDMEYGRWRRNFQSQDNQKEQQYLEGRKDLIEEELKFYLDMPERIHDAKSAFETALNLDFKEDEQMHFMYARIVEQENRETAIDHYKIAIELDPNFKEAYFNLGVVYNNEAKDLGEDHASYTEVISNSIDAYEHYVALDPSNPNAHSRLCVLFYNESVRMNGLEAEQAGRRQEFIDKAISHAEQARKLNPDDKNASQVLDLLANERQD